jgi:hypothetical protein
MSYTPIAPNCRTIVERLANEFPQEFKDCHRFNLGERAYAFVKRVAWTLHSTVDVRFGLNGKRGNTRDLSADAVSFRNPASPAGGVEVYDFVARAGASDASPAWIDQTHATVSAGTVGAFVQPEPVGGGVPVDPVRPTDPVTPVTPDRPSPCICNVTDQDVAAIQLMVAELSAVVQRGFDRQEQLHSTLVAHVDDAKGRIERVSQELANRPESSCRFPRIRGLGLFLAACLLTPTLAFGQQAVAGTTFAFDHDAESAADTERYELCVDAAEPCTTVAVLREGTTNTYRFTLPASVPRGNHGLTVRAVGLLNVGTSGPSNSLAIRVIGKPGPPTTLRQEVP